MLERREFIVIYAFTIPLHPVMGNLKRVILTLTRELAGRPALACTMAMAMFLFDALSRYEGGSSMHDGLQHSRIHGSITTYRHWQRMPAKSTLTLCVCLCACLQTYALRTNSLISLRFRIYIYSFGITVCLQHAISWSIRALAAS